MAQLELLSPVHIGDGERLTGFDFVKEGPYLKVYFFDRVIQVVEREPRNLRENILISIKTQSTAGSSFLESLFKDYPHLKNKIEPVYTVRINGKLQSLQIESFIKSVYKPYIPGSEIKGAIRHLFLVGVLMENKEIRKELIEVLQKGHIKDAEEILEKNVFYPRNAQKRNAQQDLFKAFVVSDSEPIDPRHLQVEVPELVGSNEKIYPCEALKEGTVVNFREYIDQKILPHFSKFGSYRFLDYIKPENFYKKLKEFSQKFYGDLLDEEIRFFKEKGKHQTVLHLENIKKRLNDGILLRLGKHEGYLSTTVMLLVKREDPQLFEKVFRQTQSKVRNEVNKTRRITQDGKTFGWALLKV